VSRSGERDDDRAAPPYGVERIELAGREQLSAVATRAIARGERICRFTGSEFSRQEMIERLAAGEERSGDDPFELDAERCLSLPREFLAFNHSCEPNAIFRGERDLLALFDIAAGEEITYDYSTNTSSRHGYTMKFRCRCGAPRCRGAIGDVSTIPRERLRAYYETGWLQDYIREEVSELLAEEPGA